MTRKLLTIAAATAFVVASFGAWAQNANDGPKYPNMESHKQYKDQSQPRSHQAVTALCGDHNQQAV